jgi:LacI family transcriptional regulator
MRTNDDVTARATGASGRATIKDVARVAGVGVGTVSRVVNGKSNVSEDSVAAVNSAIELLGFRRNEGARTLRTGATASIGLLVEDVADPFFSLLNRAVEEETLRRDSVLLTASSDKDPDRARKMILTFCARRVDGLVITLPESGDEDYLRAELKAGTGMVFVDRPPLQLDADVVIADNRGGATAGVAHLIGHGHRRIACFSDRADLYTARERIAGYRAALETAGIPFDQALVHASATTRAPIDEPLGEMLAMADPPTAIFAGNNRTSINVIGALATHHTVLAIVGFDDFELADVLVPGITVVAQDPRAMGKLAMELLYKRLDGDSAPAQTITLRTHLITRGSGELSRDDVLAQR